MAAAACVHATAIWIACRVTHRRPSRGLIARTWATVAWLPALMLLAYQQSPWIAAVLPVALINAALFVRQSSPEPPSPDQPQPAELFHTRELLPAWNAFAPAAIAAAGLQLGAISLALNHNRLAAILLGAGSSIAAWQLAATRPRRARRPSFLLRTLLAVLLTALASVPFLRPGESLSGFGSGPASAGNSARPSRGEGGQYTGVVLVAPVKRHPLVIPPAPKVEGLVSRSIAKPLVIDFDGAYWYFKQPDVRPLPDAKVVHGDPLKAHYHSTNTRPLTMEAHQPLSQPIAFTCCRQLGVRILNAETRPGVIAIEVRLENRVTSGSISLGLMVLSSSVAPSVAPNAAPGSPPVPETLTFRMPTAPRAGQFDEITVAIRPTQVNSRAGSRVGIESFILIP